MGYARFFLWVQAIQPLVFKAMSASFIDNIKQYLRTLLSDMELELFDIQFRQEGHGWVLRVYIDTLSGEGITLDHCSKVSRELSQYLDVEDCIDHPYHLEVSSPGLDRPLRSVEDFARHKGKRCKIRLHNALNGEKVYIGKIKAVAGEEILLEVSQGELRLMWDMLSKARLFI